ncbi:hypothetical protein SDC9_170515 [bioreactor metagenome]|uniref:YolD-like protein n=1 Tax=bioreactor metagenome TaxID=1076179 RepID=A0A645GBF6_9ZZZZ
MDEYMKAVLNNKLRIILDRIKEHPQITITYFQPDEKKNGGAYVTTTGMVKKIDEYERIVVMTEEIEIPIDEISSIDGHIFKNMY